MKVFCISLVLMRTFMRVVHRPKLFFWFLRLCFLFPLLLMLFFSYCSCFCSFGMSAILILFPFFGPQKKLRAPNHRILFSTAIFNASRQKRKTKTKSIFISILFILTFGPCLSAFFHAHPIHGPNHELRYRHSFHPHDSWSDELIRHHFPRICLFSNMVRFPRFPFFIFSIGHLISLMFRCEYTMTTRTNFWKII